MRIKGLGLRDGIAKLCALGLICAVMLLAAGCPSPWDPGIAINNPIPGAMIVDDNCIIEATIGDPREADHVEWWIDDGPRQLMIPRDGVSWANHYQAVLDTSSLEVGTHRLTVGVTYHPDEPVTQTIEIEVGGYSSVVAGVSD